MSEKQKNIRLSRGWNFLSNSKKEHWFVDGKSLCGGWGIFSATDDFRESVSDDVRCGSCQKKLDKLKLKGDVQATVANVDLHIVRTGEG